VETMNTILQYWQLIFAVLIVPLWKIGNALTRILNSQTAAIQELKSMNRTMNQELRVLKIVVFKFLPADAAKEFLKQQNEGE
jgi:hypothetical protein